MSLAKDIFLNRWSALFLVILASLMLVGRDASTFWPAIRPWLPWLVAAGWLALAVVLLLGARGGEHWTTFVRVGASALVVLAAAWALESPLQDALDTKPDATEPPIAVVLPEGVQVIVNPGTLPGTEALLVVIEEQVGENGAVKVVPASYKGVFDGAHRVFTLARGTSDEAVESFLASLVQAHEAHLLPVR